MEDKLDNFLGKVVVVTMDTHVQNKGIFLSHDNERIRLRVNPLNRDPMIFALDLKSVVNVATYKLLQERERQAGKR